MWYFVYYALLLYSCVIVHCIESKLNGLLFRFVRLYEVFAWRIHFWLKPTDFIRRIGTIPAPIIFGRLIDLSCMEWHKSCDDSGACIFYDNEIMNRNTLIIACILKSLSTVFFFCAWFMYKSPESDQNEADNTVQDDTVKSSKPAECEIREINSADSDLQRTPHRFKVQTANGLANGAV